MRDDSEPRSRAERFGMVLAVLAALFLTLAAGLEFAGVLRGQ
ncbi:MAG: hypothetical protein NW217_10090 [Hyphomicrobiaceae bacterium]|nr:hypothetical protein [Hyphomicrobiaceae bacterium]